MKNKQLYFRNASFLALLFFILGYTVKFYPEQLVAFDSLIQTAVRGSLPAFASWFWLRITILGNTPVILAITILIATVFYLKKWKAEAYLMLISFASMGVVSTALKYLYQRPRPSITWLIDTIGYSFPSWHTASTLMISGALIIILQQRLKKRGLRLALQTLFALLAVLVAISRIYIGVHYPTDIVGGWLLALTLLQLIFPFYDQIRFTWRFQSKQK